MKQGVFFGLTYALLALVEQHLASPIPESTPYYVPEAKSGFGGDIGLSDKTVTFVKRLASIGPELIKSGEQRLKDKKAAGISNFDEIFNNARPAEQKLLVKSISELYANHPEAEEELDAYLNSNRDDDFDEADEKFRKYKEWNTFWNTWFKVYADYMQKYG